MIILSTHHILILIFFFPKTHLPRITPPPVPSLSLSMAEQFLPRSWLYYVVIEEMNFTITETLRASRVEKWIRSVKRRFLNAAPIKCVGLDCEFTTHEVPQLAAVLQLSVATEILIFQICHANRVPHQLKEFLKDTTIKFLVRLSLMICAC
jgi:hypothetical protein